LSATILDLGRIELDVLPETQKPLARESLG
jgi:hypothetical protein